MTSKAKVIAPRRPILERRDLNKLVAQKKMESSSPYRRTRVEESPTVRRTAMTPRADMAEKRNQPLLDKPCNKARPKSQKGDGTGRKFAGRYCK